MARPATSHRAHSTHRPLAPDAVDSALNNALNSARHWAEALDESVSRLQDIQLACGGLKNLLGSVQRLEHQDLLAERDELWALMQLIHEALSTTVKASHASLLGLHQALAPSQPPAGGAKR